MFSKIVVGFDGAQGGRDAHALARALSAPGAEMVLVTALPYERGRSRSSVLGFQELMRSDAQSALDRAAGDNPMVTTVVADDWSAGRALHEAAEAHGADLIVIGSAHRGALGRVLVGDVSRGTLHGAPCAVAIAPRGYEDAAVRIDRIGVGVNDSDEARAALALAVGLAGRLGASLRLLTAVQAPNAVGPVYAYAYDWTQIQEQNRIAAEQDLARIAKGISDVPVQTEAVDGNAGSVLTELSEHVDLVVAGSRGWGAARRVLLGSTTDRLTHHAHCPVIVVPRGVADRARDEAQALAHA